ncbi:MAG: nuclear transport factor 2 family protein [Pseudomonadota bacterium]|nr:nuclear transport factor 2 family protein [Pseudomonadota bacterium]
MSLPPAANPALLADKQALLELNLTYCRAIDRRDLALLQSVYHEGAVEDRGGIYHGPAQGFVDLVAKDGANYEITMHRISNALFVVEGDSAEGEIYAEAYHRTRGENAMEITAAGRYLDRYEKRGGRWGIVFRAATLDRCDMRPVDQAAYQQFVAGSVAGEPGPGDLSYKVLTRFARR